MKKQDELYEAIKEKLLWQAQKDFDEKLSVIVDDVKEGISEKFYWPHPELVLRAALHQDGCLTDDCETAANKLYEIMSMDWSNVGLIDIFNHCLKMAQADNKTGYVACDFNQEWKE